MKFLIIFSLFVRSLICVGKEPIWDDRNIQDLKTKGFTLLQGLFNDVEIKEMAERFQTVKEKALDLVQNTTPIDRIFEENNRVNKSLYWKRRDEIVMQAGKGRLEFYRGFSKDLMASSHNSLDLLMRHVMVDNYTCYSGIIYSMPGSEDQYWHRDTDTLENRGTNGAKLVEMDDFYFTILIPITVPFTIENGTAEFMVSSHRMAASDFDRCETARLEVPLGSALVFNGKINHRGRANLSLEDRPALYIVYHKKWYNDQFRKGIDE